MAFLRFSRDKRGYEHFYLIETPQQRGRAPRSRILYWFRSPPGVKVGREPFDESARRALEAHNPGASFDWQKFVSTPIPPVEPEQWRERRRAERAAKIAARAEAAAESETAEAETPDVEAPEIEMPVSEALDSSLVPHAAAAGDAHASDPVRSLEAVIASSSDEPALAVQPPADVPGQAQRRKRRRRRGRRSGPSGAILSPGTPRVEGAPESPETPEPPESSPASEGFEPDEGGDV